MKCALPFMDWRILQWFFLMLLLLGSSFTALSHQLKLATTNFPPYYGEDMPNGGPFSELTRQAFAEVGYQVTVDFIPWARAVEWGKEGKIDGVMGAWVTEQRAPYFIETTPVMTNKLVFYRQRGSKTAFKSFDDIARQKLWIGTVYGYAQPQGLTEAGVNLVYTTQDKQPFMLLSRGRVDLVIVDQTYATATLALPDMRTHSEHVELIDRVVEQRDMHILVSKKLNNAEDVVKAFNVGLARLKKDGRFEQIMLDALSSNQNQTTGMQVPTRTP